MAEPLYKGYSSVAKSGIDTSVFDLELVQQDILNQFNTRRGERVGRPYYGSIIWDLLFDPGDPRTESLVIQDAERIIGEDPRVELIQLIPTISLDSNEIALRIRLRALEFDMDGWFEVTFSQSLS